MQNDQKVILLILDGWGEGDKNISNPFRFAKTINFDNLKENFPFCLLTASGLAQGLPYGEAGSCEMGHFAMGTGVVYYQDFSRINLLIESGEFYQMPQFKSIFDHCRKFNSRLHLIGLIGESFNKSSINHILALLKLAQINNFSNVYLHLFTDGLESRAKSALFLIKNLFDETKKKNFSFKLATLCGRSYALDETRNYTLKTQVAFLLLVEGKGTKVDDPFSYLENKYREENFNDSLLEPLVIEPDGIIKDNDAVIFFNYETKSITQLAEAFLDKNFDKFPRPSRYNLYIASFVKYLEKTGYPIIFERQKINVNLAKILSDQKIKQIKIIDSSRENLFRYYFNGFIEEEHPLETFNILPPFPLEDKDLILEKTREMFDSVFLIIKEKSYGFILANIPVFDVVGHGGDFNLAIQAVEFVDNLIDQLVRVSLANEYSLIITSDHGNIEKLIDIKMGEKDLRHNISPVPFYLIDSSLRKQKTKDELSFFSNKILGSLVDIPATILDLMKIKIPPSFEGKSLLRYF